MFEWLIQEIETINTNRFHVLHAPAFAVLDRAQTTDNIPLPACYREFTASFGTALMFRDGDHYLLRVSERPWISLCDETGAKVLCFGGFDEAEAYFDLDSLILTGDSPVFERLVSFKGKKVAESFGEWMKLRYLDAKLSYSELEWKRLEIGPKAFSDHERRIMESRKLFTWRVVGKTTSGAYQIEVDNRSDIVLPFLSIGVRARDNSFVGGIWIPTSAIHPHTKGMVTHNVYTNTGLSTDIELFDLPDPLPEDRERYWEFR